MRVNLLCVEITCIGSYVQLTNGNVHSIERILFGIADALGYKNNFQYHFNFIIKKKLVIDLKIKIISYII